MNEAQAVARVRRWPLFGRKKEASQLILAKYEALGVEAGKLAEEIERAQPPVDSRHIIPVGDHIKVVVQMQVEIDHANDRANRTRVEYERKLDAANAKIRDLQGAVATKPEGSAQ